MEFIKYFNELSNPDLSEVGGKGANLGILTAHGMLVPEGFCILTKGYHEYIKQNGIGNKIEKLLDGLDINQVQELEAISSEIRELFSVDDLPKALKNEIMSAYIDMNNRYGHHAEGAMLAVAVRSSATFEDLPGMSFAGQQDTYLNVRGIDSLLKAVSDCMASLWTARAIGYRQKNSLDQASAALCVVVQKMVKSEVSGVMFTANPLTGNRSEIVIDASFGLGEALVSGQVEPDNYIVNKDNKQVISKRLGEKAVSIRPEDFGGTRLQMENKSGLQALSDERIVELADIGQIIHEIYKTPQDIEWALESGKIYILQARPITSLFPKPYRYNPGDIDDETSKRLYFSFAAWQVMLDPITPAGRDIIYAVAAGVAKRLGFDIDMGSQNAFVTAGERLYVNITPLARDKFGRKPLKMFLSSLEPATCETLDNLLNEQNFALKKSRLAFTKRVRLLKTFASVIKNVASLLLNPRRGKIKLQKAIDEKLDLFRAELRKVKDFSELNDWFQNIFMMVSSAFLIYLPTSTIAGQVPFQALLRIVQKISGGQELVLELTRGLANNVTTEMDLALWDVASIIKSDSFSFEYFKTKAVDTILRDERNQQLPKAAQEAVNHFLDIYGARGMGEIDLGRKRWNEDPLHILQILKSYVELDEEASPLRIFEESRKKAEEARFKLINETKKAGFNPIKRKVIKFFMGRVRELTGLRETPKFAVVRIMKIIRDKMLELGRQACADGIINDPEDVFFLYINELKKLSKENAAELRETFNARRESYKAEMNRKQVPNLLSSDGTIYLDACGNKRKDGLGGTPVSAGIAEGTARVVLDPRSTRLLPGEILVCPATDPAWTPLFLVASGLIMEVGGLMTHGSVVAREYGIPAVAGIKNATEVIKTGQRVRVNGNNGVIEVLK